MRRVVVCLAVLLLVVVAAAVLLTTQGDPVLTPPAAGPGEDAVDAPPAAASEGEETGVAPTGPGAITGLVRRGGRLVPARLEVRRRGAEPVDELLADGEVVRRLAVEGRFVLEHLPWGRYEIAAFDDAGRRGAVTVAISDRAPRAVADVDLPEATHELRGIAVWSDGRPFEGVVAARAREDRALPDGEPAEVVFTASPVATDADGRFVLAGLPPGRFRLEARLPGRLGVRGPFVRVPAAGEVRFVVDEGLRAVEGRVLAAEDDAPIEGAVVTSRFLYSVEETLAARTATNADGRFRTWVAAKLPWLRAAKEGYAAGGVSARVPGEEVVLRLARIPAPGRVRGSVLDAAGAPAAGAVVRCAGAAPAVAAVDGSYLLEGVPPGDRVVFVRGGGYVSTLLANAGERPLEGLVVTVPAGEEVERDLAVEATGSATVRVLDEESRPAPGLRVALRWQPGSVRSRRRWGEVTSADGAVEAATDGDGRVRFDDLCPGSWYEPRVIRPGRPDVVGKRFAAMADRVPEVELRLPAEVTRTVRLVLAGSGRPLAGAVLRMHRIGRSALADSRVTDERGEAVLGPFPAGELRFTVRHPDAAFHHERLDLEPGEGPVVVELEPAVEIRGRVVWEDGSPAAGIRVEFGVPGRDACSGRTGFDGTFRFVRLPEGTGHVYAGSERNGLEYEAFASGVKTGADEVVLVLRPRPEREAPDPFTVRVLGPDGSPATGGRVLFWRRHGPPEATGNLSLEGRARCYANPLPPELFVEVVGATADGAHFAPKLVGPVAAVGELEVRLETGRTLRGRTVDESGAPVLGVAVTATAANPDRPVRGRRPRGEVASGEGGAFTIPGLGAEDLRLEVVPPAPFARVEVTARAGAEEVTIVLPRGATPLATVLDDQGEPLEGATLYLQAEGGGRLLLNPYLCRTDRDGRLRLPPLDPRARFRLDVRPPAGRNRDLLFEVLEPWSPEDTVVRLARPLSITGVLRVAGEPPNGRLQVWWRRTGERDWQWTGTDTDGTFRIDGLRDGDYELAPEPNPGTEGVVRARAGADGVIVRRP